MKNEELETKVMRNRIKWIIVLAISAIVIPLGFFAGNPFIYKITLTMDDFGTIIPVVDSKIPEQYLCPEGYRIMINPNGNRCLLIQERNDCLETEIYFETSKMCVPTYEDSERYTCGDRYFLDSVCHKKYLALQSNQKEMQE